ncbi:hypothetical protein RF679_01490 [Undibacterium cyanobacteriorum]|uniref:PspA/IM30 family protein n=1 Tax=Undibacterium cyanobacteriorum TaxID=3073561 RepID=A0ABY9RJY2_9BURK|nr:hypothetical protein [Undibacterium sp. 20NA77.5]WMW80970.1 hypothetical protein RF679_01490 [Undibacterium sp. 20NA77.5]
MSNLNGWGLTARLISKHFGALGDKIAETIAGFDPETATEADRDRLAATLREAAQKLASARASFKQESGDVQRLRELIKSDEKVSLSLAERLSAGSISEATVNLFCDELEANKARLPIEEQEAADAQEYMNELQKIVDALSQELAQFDAAAKKSMQNLASAKAQKDLQELRMERQSQLASLSGIRGQSSALNALTKRAEKVMNEAAGLRIVADIAQKPIDQAAEIDAIRRSVAKQTNDGETTLQRLQRLSNKNDVEVAA